MIQLELYRAFYAVAKTGSLTAAAKELYVSQPALSQSIHRLEQQLGGRLFVRTSKGMELTPEGEQIFGYVERAISLLDLAQNRFDEMKNLVAGTIRIGASDTLCRHFLLPYIRTFHERYPQVHIQVTNRTSSDTIALLRAGKVDIAFINLPFSGEDLNIYHCIPLHDGFAAGKKFKNTPTITVETLPTLPLVMMETASNTRRFLDRHLLGKGIKITPEIELGSFDLVVEFAKAGLGIAYVTREFIQKELQSGELTMLPDNLDLPPRAIAAVTLKNLPTPFAAGRFLEMIRHEN